MRSVWWLLVGPFERKPVKLQAVVQQMVVIGVRSVPMVVMLAFFMGLVLAMQGAYVLQRLGAEIFVTQLVAVAFFREIGPLFAGIVLAGRCGSAMTAEIGTMKTAEEIEALEVMAINPVRYLVAPRLAATVVMMPALTMLANVAGNVGGWVIGLSIGLNSELYVSSSVDALVLKDLWTGMVKAVVYAALVATIACQWGMSVSGGAEGVGKATTGSVVTSLIAILAADVMLTAVFYFGV